MSHHPIDFEESRRCAAVITALASRLRALITEDGGESCRMLQSYCQTLDTLGADLLAETDECEGLDSAALTSPIVSSSGSAEIDISKIILMLEKISFELDGCTAEVPEEIEARSNLYSRMKETAKEARMLIKELT